MNGKRNFGLLVGAVLAAQAGCQTAGRPGEWDVRLFDANRSFRPMTADDVESRESAGVTVR